MQNVSAIVYPNYYIAYLGLLCFFLIGIYIGLLTALHKDYFRVINHKDLLFNDFGDRVAQLLHVELIAPFLQYRSNNVHQEMLIVNTHLLFPHNSSLCLERLRQVCESLHNSLLTFNLVRSCCDVSCYATNFAFYYPHLLFRYTKYCNVWNHIKKKTNSIHFLLYYAGKPHISCLL